MRMGKKGWGGGLRVTGGSAWRYGTARAAEHVRCQLHPDHGTDRQLNPRGPGQRPTPVAGTAPDRRCILNDVAAVRRTLGKLGFWSHHSPGERKRSAVRVITR